MRIVVADDSVLFREGLIRVLSDRGLAVVGRAGDAEELLEQVELHQPDIAITDIRMPPTFTAEGLIAAEQIRRRFPRISVLVLSQYVETQHAMRLVGEGGRIGYLLKDRVSDIGEFTDAVRAVAEGRSVIDPEVVAQLVSHRRSADLLSGLTVREREVLGLMAEGRSNQAICDRLFLSPKTIEAHVRTIFGKLQLEPEADDHRRVLAVLAYLRSESLAGQA